MQDIIFISMENWDDIWRRNQFLVAEFARRFPNQKILFVGLSIDVSYGVRTGNFSVVWKALFPERKLHSPPGLPNVLLLNIPKWLPNSLASGRGFNQKIEQFWIRRAVRELNLSRPLLWINFHHSMHLVGKLEESGVVYDITDDWTSLSQTEATRQQVIRDDRELCRLADEVIVCSERLYEMKQGMARSLHLVPNGVDVERYRLVPYRDPAEDCLEEAEKALPLPSETRDWTRPVLGYTGSVHPDRMDFDLLIALAKRFPQATFPLIGALMLTGEERTLLQNQSNIRLVGPVPYRELQAWMRSFDACIVPHKVTPFTESLNPLKLFEYLASGLPVVTTDVAGFRDYGQESETPFVYVAKGNEGQERIEAFCHAIEQALAERANLPAFAALRQARQTEAAQHTWSKRADTIVQLLKPLKRDVPDVQGER